MCGWQTHAGTGMLFGAAVSVGLTAAGVPLPPEVALGFPVIAAYASAVPDVDHHSAKIRFVVPPARWLFVAAGWVTARACGEAVAHRWFRHRGVTHSVLFALSLGLATSLGLLFILPSLSWVGAAVATGCLAHVAGDACTTQGVPLWAPCSWRTFGLRLFSTGRFGEHVFAATQLGCTLALLLWAT